MFELRKYLAITGIIAAIFLAIGCGSNQDTENQSASVEAEPAPTTTLPPIRPTRPEDVIPPAVKDISASDAAAMMHTNPNLQIVDLREDWMYGNKHIKGAVLINIESFEQYINHLDKKKPVLVYDNEGETGHRATDILLKHGYKEIYYLIGGASGWTYEIEPVQH